MTQVREASCRCGAVRVACRGEPVRISVCHCLACQQRTGSAFASQVRFPAERVTVTGGTRVWTRTGDSGAAIDYRFCPECGSTMAYVQREIPDVVAVPIGAFADPDAFPAPWAEVYAHRKFGWVEVTTGDAPDTPRS
ncbi:GFA family protein [Sphingomonas sp. MS122]|uniref:GFA family protein n=1 Tax=Sphingomonas sp. MS122 TaxID=3412683 RepID=UPI003C2B09F5